jgi:hypothetical protein
MLLYDIFYHGASMDRAVPLPKKPDKGTRYAVCINGEKRILVPRRGEWVDVTETTTEQEIDG